MTKKQRWYFGGLASAGAAICTHPLDLIKVHLQTQHSGKIKILPSIIGIVKHQGFLSLYNGLSASLLRQLTYSTTRFGMYEISKQYLDNNDINTSSLYTKLMLAGFAGMCGGIVGSPADMINVRMQNDIKLSKELRRNYKHALNGLYQVNKKEGFPKLFSGVIMATSRGIFMTIGQLAFYDQIKQLLMKQGHFVDNVETHVISSVSASIIATTLTQPLDVLKTRMMNAKPGQYKGINDCAVDLFKSAGLSGFYKGYVPAFVRLAPHTILTFVFLEQLTKHFGVST